MEPRSLITIMMCVAMAASVCLVVHVRTRERVPLWVAVPLLCGMEVLGTLPLGRY